MEEVIFAPHKAVETMGLEEIVGVIIMVGVCVIVAYSIYKAITYPVKLMKGDANFKEDIKDWWDE